MFRILTTLLLLLTTSFAWADEKPLRLLVITGSHGFDARFYSLFEGYPDIEWDKKTQTSKPSAAFSEGFADDYDAVLLYDFEMSITDAQKKAFEDAFGDGRGLLVMHHALCSHPNWPKYREIIGGQFLFQAQGDLPQSTYKGNVNVSYQVADKDHPITQGVKSFQVIEEPYKYVYKSPKAIPLLTSENPESDPVVAWTTNYRKSRVVTFIPGHGGDIFDDPNYRRFLAQSIRWVASKKEGEKDE